MKRFIVSLLLGGALSGVTLYLAFRNVPMSDLIDYLGTISYSWIVPSAALVLMTFVLRVFRWRIILQDSLPIGFWPAFHPLMIGFMINCILPGRVGEIARPALLKQQQKLPMTTGLATVAAERMFDMMMLIALFAAVFSTATSRPDLDIAFGGFTLDGRMLQSVAWAMIRLSIVLLFGLGLLAFSGTRRWIMRVMDALTTLAGMAGPRAAKISMRLNHLSKQLLQNVADGLTLVRHPWRVMACIGLTVAIWAMTVLAYYVFSLGSPGVELSMAQVTTVVVITCFFIALPSVPGFWGLWEAGGIFALSLFGIVGSDAAGYTLVNHAVQMFPVIIVGLVSALVTSVNVWHLTYGKKVVGTPEFNDKRSIASESS
jgi:glycosyltransferase 2 family protein